MEDSSKKNEPKKTLLLDSEPEGDIENTQKFSMRPSDFNDLADLVNMMGGNNQFEKIPDKKEN